MKLYYDLHMHSCLSPCGDNDMTPNNIVGMAALQQLDVIALSDHNCAKNVEAVKKLAEQNGILFIPAIEITTAEEVHILSLFSDVDRCLELSDILYFHLPDIKNVPEIFGEQIVMDSDDNKVDSVDKLLINATDLSLEQVVNLVREHNGIPIPAHVDKNANSIISNLGFIPDDLDFKCIEVKTPPYECGFFGNIVTNSDAHYLEDINGRNNYLEVEQKSVEAILKRMGK